MRLHEIDHLEVRRLVRDVYGGLLVVLIAPNFEARSLRLCELILEEIAWAEATNVPVREIRWLVVTLQGKHADNSLDSLKASYAYRSLTWLSKLEGEHVRHKVWEYPVSSARLEKLFLSLLRGWHPKALLADFSALPRNILFKLLRTLDTSDYTRNELSGIRHVYLTYVWARSYPHSGNLEAVGDVTGHFTDSTLTDFLQPAQYANTVLVTSGSVHDSFSVVSSVADVRGGRDLKRQIVTFVNRYNYSESWRQLRNHYTILDKSASEGWTHSYAFSIDHALAIFYHAAQDTLSKGADMDSRLALCTFGPKPLAVGAQLIVEDVRRQAVGEHRVSADLFNSHGSQYLSTYSMGAGGISVFEYSRTERLDLGNQQGK